MASKFELSERSDSDDMRRPILKIQSKIGRVNSVATNGGFDLHFSREDFMNIKMKFHVFFIEKRITKIGKIYTTAHKIVRST